MVSNYKAVPKEYTLHLDPDLEQFSCPGWVSIDVEKEKPGDTIVLNAAALEITTISVKQGTQEHKAEFRLNEEKEELTVLLGKDLRGAMTLRIGFRARINDGLEGFYRSSFVREGKTEYVATTQFEESDARRAFPCFDHPSLKAVFNVEMVIDSRYTAISNAMIAETIAQDDGRQLIRFKPTPKMSSYLLFFGVGEFDYIEDSRQGKKIRVAAVPGRAKFGRFAIDCCKKALDYGETYTGIEYPLGKMDLIALTDFAFGAMENFGAITFRENLALLFPGKSSQADIEKIANVTAHEVAHMWFGDLVSPSAWKFIWLNESFATLFTTLIIDSYFPEWKEADKFVAKSMSSTMERDSLPSTIPMELPEDGPVAITTASAPIVYGKGAAVLKMIQTYLGSERFRKGVQAYLAAYAFDCADTSQCWQEFDRVLEDDITGMMNSWIYQPGLPEVECRHEENRLFLTQKKFSYLPIASEQTWKIPVTLEYHLAEGGIDRSTLLLDKKETVVELPGEITCYKVNFHQSGYYRVSYGEDNLQALGSLIKAGDFHPTDRFGVQADLWALVKAGRKKVKDYLAYIGDFYGDETEFLPLAGILPILEFIHRYLPQHRDSAAKLITALSKPVLQRVGWEPDDDEPTTDTSLRRTVFEALRQIDDSETIDFASRLWEEYMAGKDVHPDLLSVALFTATERQPGAVDYLLGVFEGDDTTEPERIVILEALGRVRDTKELKNVLDYTLNNVPPKNRRIPIVAASYNPESIEQLWKWFTANKKEVAKIHPFHYGIILNAVLPAAGVTNTDTIETYARKELTSDVPGVNDSLEMAIENMRIMNRLIQSG